MKTSTSRERRLRVLIADDHPLIRRGIREIVAGAYGEVQIGEATTTQEALDSISRQAWDLVLLDITMPGRSGLDVLKEVRQAHPQLPVLVLSVHAEREYAIRVLKAGAAGYVTKDKAPEVLLEAMAKALAGGRYVSPSVAEQLAVHVQAGAKELPHQALSDREYEVLRLIATGKTVSEIAAELALSVKTVSTYRTRIMEKMGMRTNAELMKYAVQHGVTD